MFRSTAEFYDAVYSFKDYAGESKRVAQLIRERKPDARTLLDAACGTGTHLAFFREDGFDCEGFDLDPGLLEVARQKNPGVPLHEANMIDFALERTFDAVTCLFSAIGYVQTLENLHAAIERMAAHLNDGGVLVVEPWLRPDTFTAGRLDTLLVDEPDVKILRISRTSREGMMSYLDFDYVIATHDKTEMRHERHAAALFTDEEYLDAFRRAGLKAELEPDGLMAGRGLLLGVKR